MRRRRQNEKVRNGCSRVFYRSVELYSIRSEMMALIFEQFLRLIDNQNCWWKFNIIGNAEVTGQVTDYLMDTRGTPITLKVRQEDRVTVEIPWTSIQYITAQKTENY